MFKSQADWLKSLGLLLHQTGMIGTNVVFSWTDQGNTCGCTLIVVLYKGFKFMFYIKVTKIWYLIIKGGGCLGKDG